MNPGNPARFVEQFHLVFLVQLGRRLDRRMFVLKGGCNFRFFHRSVRYSKDMDLDLADLEVTTLRDKTREILESRPFAQILEARGIRVDRVTEHKQTETETTQRWKLGLRVEGVGVPLPTKIEFSRRGLDEGIDFGSVDPSVARACQLTPLMLSHYGPPAAFRQKVRALAGRAETQARDVFDLHHLLTVGGTEGALAALDRGEAERASANAMAVDFGMFKSQVLSYLPPEDQASFDSPSVWDTVVLEVVEALRTATR